MHNTKTALKNYMNLKKQVVLDGLLVGVFAGFFTVSYRLMLSFLSDLRFHLFQKFSFLNVIGVLLLFSLFALIVGYLIRFCPLILVPCLVASIVADYLSKNVFGFLSSTI